MLEVRRWRTEGRSCDVMASWYDDRKGATLKNRGTAMKAIRWNARKREERKRGEEKGRRLSEKQKRADRIEGVAG